jgi:hypothetical protein
MNESYRALTLVEGDSDAALRWGGEPTPNAEPLLMEALVAPDEDGRTANTLATPAPVQSLQRDLAELGFTLLRDAEPGEVDRLTRWAIREFQIYARMPLGARQTRSGATYVEQLEQVRLSHRYEGPVSGVANEATLAAIRHWRRYRLRCPVVVSAWNADSRGRPTTVHRENIWLHDEEPARGVPCSCATSRITTRSPPAAPAPISSRWAYTRGRPGGSAGPQPCRREAAGRKPRCCPSTWWASRSRG